MTNAHHTNRLWLSNVTRDFDHFTLRIKLQDYFQNLPLTFPTNDGGDDGDRGGTGPCCQGGDESGAGEGGNGSNGVKVLEIFLPERSNKSYAFVTVETPLQAQAVLQYSTNTTTTNRTTTKLFDSIQVAQSLRPRNKRYFQKLQQQQHETLQQQQTIVQFVTHSNIILQVNQSHQQRIIDYLKQHQQKHGKTEDAKTPTCSSTQKVAVLEYHVVGSIIAPIQAKTMSWIFLKIASSQSHSTRRIMKEKKEVVKEDENTNSNSSTNHYHHSNNNNDNNDLGLLQVDVVDDDDDSSRTLFMNWIQSIWFLQSCIQRFWWIDQIVQTQGISNKARGEKSITSTIQDHFLPWILKQLQKQVVLLQQLKQQSPPGIRLKLVIFPLTLQQQVLPLLEQALLLQQQQPEPHTNGIVIPVVLTSTRATHSISILQLITEQEEQKREEEVKAGRIENRSLKSDTNRNRMNHDQDHATSLQRGLYALGKIQTLSKSTTTGTSTTQGEQQQQQERKRRRLPIPTPPITNTTVHSKEELVESDDHNNQNNTDDNNQDDNNSVKEPYHLTIPPSITTTTTTTTTTEICRAYSKLQEAWERYPYNVPLHPRRILDCGAAPGGWTQFLVHKYGTSNTHSSGSRYGTEKEKSSDNDDNNKDDDDDNNNEKSSSSSICIYSIDPGTLHPTVLALPHVHHVAQTIQKALVEFSTGASSNDRPAAMAMRMKMDIWVSDMCVKDMEQQVDWLLAARDLQVVGSGTFCVLTLKCLVGHSSATYDAQCQIQRQRLEPYFQRYSSSHRSTTTTSARTTTIGYQHHEDYCNGSRGGNRATSSSVADNTRNTTTTEPLSLSGSSSESSLCLVHLFGNRQSERTLMGYML